MAAAVQRENQSLPADLRDMLTRTRLEGAVAHLAGVEVLEFSGDWWDGQTYTPCLVVRGGRRHRLLRVVETLGEAVVVPFEKRSAQRWLADRRRPGRIEFSVPPQRAASDVLVDATVDVTRCPSPTCGALLPVGYVDACPVCGGAPAIEEKSTATGARTSGSSTSK